MLKGTVKKIANLFHVSQRMYGYNHCRLRFFDLFMPLVQLLLIRSKCQCQSDKSETIRT
jgi:hypothetical protein